MKIAVVGAGAVGMLYAEKWVAAGHTVVLSYTRNPDRLPQKAAAIGASAATPREAASVADVVLFCPPYECIDDAADQLGSVAGTVLIDTTNPFNPDRSGLVDLAEGETAFKAVARAIPGARQVKAFHNLAVAQVTDAAVDRPVIFIAGDAEDARQVVSRLVIDAGLTPVETGDLETARLSEAPGPLFMTIMNADDSHAALGKS